jgi:hypothetical protein
MSGCRDCEKCTRTGMQSCLINTGRIVLAICTFLISEVVLWILNVNKRKCPECKHPLVLHARDREGRFID